MCKSTGHCSPGDCRTKLKLGAATRGDQSRSGAQLPARPSCS
ncbi:hypothetical protein SETIT_5G223200v2 [Setaria italica]|uniref:Uncharacterized protein n=1 Tax=Setaria italica TaxID=4555 RepID=A0A368R7W0_SETIT|nr:hypothetical protein SETIT_5G223200v2 [Setaria italica]